MRPRAWFVVLGLFLSAVGAKTLYASDVIIPEGTILTVQTTQPIYADYTQPGMRLNGIVEYPVEVAGRIVVPQGTLATLEVVGVDRSSTLKGRDRISLTVQSLQIGGNTYPVSSNAVQLRGPSEGKRATKKILGGAGIGAVVGGLFGGGSGAAIGALAGGGTGAAVAGSGKSHLIVPAETRLQFQIAGMPRIVR